LSTIIDQVEVYKDLKSDYIQEGLLMLFTPCIYNEPNIVKVIKSSRLRWAVHVARMDEKELPKKIM